MTLEWYEWECPYCRRIGQVNPARGYENGETMRMSCPYCMGEVVVLCEYEPTFVAYRPEHWKEHKRREEKAADLCYMCANKCDERKTIHVGQSAYAVCDRWKEGE